VDSLKFKMIVELSLRSTTFPFPVSNDSYLPIIGTIKANVTSYSIWLNMLIIRGLHNSDSSEIFPTRGKLNTLPFITLIYNSVLSRTKYKKTRKEKI